MAEHQTYMQQALELASKGRYTTSPNPMVGCVIVKDGQVIGQGYHQFAGGPHAEIHALNEAGSNAQGATAYVSLEPCCHHGRTPPCTDALIQAGIKTVYVACTDANPIVAGKGVKALQQADIEVHVGLCEADATQLNAAFFHFIQHRTPFVIAKWAMSIDGKTITQPTDEKQISGVEAQQHTHELRQQVDAILIGANTAKRDNPLLTARFSPIVKQPIRIILSRCGDLPLDLTIFSPEHPGETYLAVTDDIHPEQIDQFASRGVKVIFCEKNLDGNIAIPSLLKKLGELNIMSLLVEGGMATQAHFFKSNCVNKIITYLSPVIISSLENKKQLSNCQLIKLNNDYVLSATL